MIPRLKPYFNHREFAAVFSADNNAVENFEKKLAAKFKAKYAVSFLYGRSGLYTILKSLGIYNSEIIIPAYTCVVVANAVVYSGNIPKFVDIDLDNYGMNPDLLEKAINDKTKAIFATPLFGYPYDVNRLKDIIRRSGRRILLIQDCAHGFGTRYDGELICNMGDAALFAFSITKELSTIYGGAVTTNDEDIYKKIKKYRDEYFRIPARKDKIKMLALLITAYIAFFKPFYAVTNFLEKRTKILDPIVKYYKDDIIDMPEDYLQLLPSINAKIGSVQLDKYDIIMEKRRETANFYNEALKGINGITPPLLAEGASYLYCISMVKDKRDFIKYMAKKGVQIGEYIEYAVPYMRAYQMYRQGEDYPNALLCSRNIVNLPCHPTLSKRELEKIVGYISDYFLYNREV